MTDLSRIRTIFRDDPEAQVQALAAKLAREAGEVVAWNGITAASYCARAARLLFPSTHDAGGSDAAARDTSEMTVNNGFKLGMGE